MYANIKQFKWYMKEKMSNIIHDQRQITKL